MMRRISIVTALWLIAYGCLLMGCSTASVGLSGRIVDRVTQAPVVNADLCVLDLMATPPCVKSTSEGSFDLLVVAGEPLLVSVEKDGVEPSLFMVAPVSADVPTRLDLRVGDSERLFKVLSVAGIPSGAGEGGVMFNVDSGGVRVELVPTSVRAYAINPIELSAEKIRPTGTPRASLVAFFRVPPGRLTLRVEHDTKTCFPSTLSVEVRAGLITQLTDVTCQ